MNRTHVSSGKSIAAPVVTLAVAVGTLAAAIPVFASLSAMTTAAQSLTVAGFGIAEALLALLIHYIAPSANTLDAPSGVWERLAALARPVLVALLTAVWLFSWFQPGRAAASVAEMFLYWFGLGGMMVALAVYVVRLLPAEPDHPNDGFMRLLYATVFMLLSALLFGYFSGDTRLGTDAQKWVYSILLAETFSGLAVYGLCALRKKPSAPALGGERPVWFFPLLAGVLTLVALGSAYVLMGIWPIGERTALIVDLHHQYAPMLSELRDMLLGGGDAFYSTHAGMGMNFFPMFAYYLASPLNLLLVLFPEHLLAEAIFVIMFIKNVVTAVLFALAMQYILRKRTPLVVVAALMYSLSMYMLAYSWNIMWLDVIMVLPLVIMGFERMMRTGKYLLYILSLAYCLFTNYYIGFMVCVFLVLYYLTYIAREKRTGREVGRSFTRFAIGSALGGGLVMFLLLPTAFGLGTTSAAGDTLPELGNYFNMFELPGQLLYNMKPTIRYGNLPNLYCGLLAVLIVPIFATIKEISLRRRLAYLGLLGLLSASLVINQMNLGWHGLHSPNDLPYRFSFLIIFALALITAITLANLRHIRPRQILWSVFGIAVYLMLAEAGNEEFTFANIYTSLFVVLILGGILLLFSHRKIALSAVSALLLLTVTAELTMNAGTTLLQLNSQEYYTRHEDYLDNQRHEVLSEAVEYTQTLADQQTDGSFYRMEFLPSVTCTDTSLYHYNGLTVFSSTNYYTTTRFMGSMGYAVNGVNSYIYHSFCSPIDSLLGLRYLMLQSSLTNHAQLKQLDRFGENENTYYLYENIDALPLAMAVNSSAKTWFWDYYNPIRSQNSLFTALTGNSDTIYKYQNTVVSPGSEDVATMNGDLNFSLRAGDASVSADFETTITDAGQAFIYIDCRAAESINVSCNNNYWTVTPHEPFIIDAGTLSVGDVVHVTVKSSTACSGNIYVASLDTEVYEENMSTLRDGGMELTSYSASHITGNITADQACSVFTSIPYDAGWTVKVDGRTVETWALGENEDLDEGGALLMFDIPAGTHEVEMSFRPKGFVPGLLISLFSLAALVVLLWFMRRRTISEVDAKASDDTLYSFDLPIKWSLKSSTKGTDENKES